MQHTVKLKVKAGKVSAEPNPLPNVRPGDTVRFEVGPTLIAKAGHLEVEFHEVRSPCGPEGPFAAPAAGSGAFSGQVGPQRNGLFIYRVFAVQEGPQGVQRKPLDWVNGLDPGGNFGGIDVPKPPPKG